MVLSINKLLLNNIKIKSYTIYKGTRIARQELRYFYDLNSILPESIQLLRARKLHYNRNYLLQKRIYRFQFLNKTLRLSQLLMFTEFQDLFTLNFNYYKKYEIIVITTSCIENKVKEFIFYNLAVTKLLQFFYFFKYHTLSQYKILIDIIFIDKTKFTKTLEQRFLHYHLLSLRYNGRINIISYLPTQRISLINSLIFLYKSAGWYEREIWDLYGIFFKNHWDLKKVLTDYGFLSSPFQKNFPITGYLELKYNFISKKILYKGFKLNYIYRSFNFLTGWEWM